MQADRGLAGARRALHADRLVEVGPDQLVLVGLDGGDDVAHRPDAGPLDLGGEDPRRGAQLLAPVEVLVLEAGERAGLEPEPAAHRDALRVAGAGLVEGAGQRRPPVQHHRLAGVVGDVPPADVVGLPGVIAWSPKSAGRRTAAWSGRRPVRRSGGPGYGRGSRRCTRRRRPCRRWEEVLGPLAHPAQRGPGLGEVGALGGDLGPEVIDGACRAIGGRSC